MVIYIGGWQQYAYIFLYFNTSIMVDLKPTNNVFVKVDSVTQKLFTIILNYK